MEISVAHSDDDLMVKIGQGNQGAFGDLFDRHGGKVLGYATRLLGSREKAEDLAQEVWMKVITQAPHYDGKGQFIAWVYTITRNAAFNLLRGEKKFSNHISMDEENFGELPDSQDILEEFNRAEDRRHVREAVDALPDMQRVALITWLTEDLSYEELAHKMEITESALKSLLFRARKAVIARVQGAVA